jgi:hypothetical protein
LTGDLALTARANLSTKWLRRAPVARWLVRFFGLPMWLAPSWDMAFIEHQKATTPLLTTELKLIISENCRYLNRKYQKSFGLQLCGYY